MLRLSKKGTGDKKSHGDGAFRLHSTESSATERPFTIKDGKAFGPGVLDMKGGIAVALYAMLALYSEGWNDKDITVFFCGDEEHAHPIPMRPSCLKKPPKGSMPCLIWKQPVSANLL